MVTSVENVFSTLEAPPKPARRLKACFLPIIKLRLWDKHGNSEVVHALLDTGAGQSILQSNRLKSLQLSKIRCEHVNLTGVDQGGRLSTDRYVELIMSPVDNPTKIYRHVALDAPQKGRWIGVVPQTTPKWLFDIKSDLSDARCTN